MKIIKQGITTLLLATCCVSVTVAEEANEIPVAERERIAEMFESIDPGDVFKSPVDGWYTIQSGSIVAYITTDGRYLLQGDLIDLDTQTNVTEASRSNARRDLMSSVDAGDTIVFSPEEVKYTVSVFTDIDCTYCRRLHSEIDGYLDEGIEVRYLLYPRGGPASRSWNTSEDVWCSKDRGDALTQAKLDRNFETSKCDCVHDQRSLRHGSGSRPVGYASDRPG